MSDNLASLVEWINSRFQATPFDFNELTGFGTKDNIREFRELSDISAHLPLLRFLALQCRHITEFGMRDGFSTAAFLSANPEMVVSYDIQEYNTNKVLAGLPNWQFKRANTSNLSLIEPTDLLFIDSLHTYAQVVAELKMARFVRKFIVFHDTVSQGEKSLDVPGEEGINRAIREFMDANKEWSLGYSASFNHGLVVLQKKGAFHAEDE